jgi:hypothetical protein
MLAQQAAGSRQQAVIIGTPALWTASHAHQPWSVVINGPEHAD